MTIGLQCSSVSEELAGEVVVEGRGIRLTLNWRYEHDQVRAIALLCSTQSGVIEQREISLMPRFPHVVYFMGCYIHLNLSVRHDKYTIYVSLPKENDRTWRGPVARFRVSAPALEQLETPYL